MIFSRLGVFCWCELWYDNAHDIYWFDRVKRKIRGVFESRDMERKMVSKRLAIGVACILGMAFCGCESSGDGDFAFSIYATPSRSHAPIDVAFELLRDDGNSVEACVGDWFFGDGVTLSGEVEARHKYREAGQYEVRVELNCQGERSRASTAVEIFDSVDLSVAGVQARPLNISTGGVLSVSAQIANSASAPLNVPTTVDVYLASSNGSGDYLAQGATRIYRQTIDSLGKVGEENSVKQLGFEISLDSSIRTGAYYVAVVVNGEGYVGEGTLEDNVAYSAQTVTVLNDLTDGADLEAKRLEVVPSLTPLLSSVTASFQIVNIGATTDETFRYEIWMGAKDNGTDLDGASLVHESTLTGGVSHAEQNVQNVLLSIAPAISEPGLYYFWLVLNRQDDIRERDKTNNVVRSTAPVQVTDEVILEADIAVESVEFSPSSSSPGGTFMPKITLVNQGSQPTGSFVCTVFLSEDMGLDIDKDIVVGSINIDDLGPNSRREASASAEIDHGVKAGSYWVYVFCDSSGVVAEANESNNIQRSEKMFSVTGNSNIDLVVGNASYLTEGPYSDGDAIRGEATLCNKGQTGAGPSWLSVSRRNRCDDTATEVSRELIEGLEAGECVTVSFENALVCDFWCPNYGFEMTADATGIVTETRKENNRVEFPSLSVSGASCACEGDKYEPNDLWGTAQTIGSIDEDLTLCANDKDFFKLAVSANGTYEVKLTHDAQRAPLQLDLYHGTEVIATYTGTDNLYISESHLGDVVDKGVRIAVSGGDKANANRYRLTTQVYGETTGVDLAASQLRLDGDMSASSATRVSLQIDNLGSVRTPEVKVGFYLSSTMEVGDDAMRIGQRAVGALEAGGQTTIAIDLQLPIDLAGGNYYLIARVDDKGVLDDVRPTNNIARSSMMHFDRSCFDILDPNESIETARKLTFQNGESHYTGLTVCQSNPDYYAFDVKHGQQLTISATAETAGDFDIYLYDRMGNEMDSSRTAAAIETIHDDYILGDQTLYLAVVQTENSYNSKETRYSLDISVQDAPEWMICSEAYEPNNFMSVAYDLRLAVQMGLEAQICPDTDEDYYRIELEAGERLQLGFETSSALLRAGLYKGDTMEFVSLLTNLRVQAFDYTAITDGTYYVRVFTNAASLQDNAYKLKWLGASYATDVGVSNVYIPSPIEAGMSATVSFDVRNYASTSANYTAYIQMENQTMATISGSLDGNAFKRESHKIVVPKAMLGDVACRIRVSAPGDSNPNNDEVEKHVRVLPVCLNDAYEPNDNILQAKGVAENSTISGVICMEDEDWFVVPTDATEAVLTGDGASSLLKFASFRADGSLLESSEIGTATDRISVEQARYLRVKGADSASSVNYTLVFLP